MKEKINDEAVKKGKKRKGSSKVTKDEKEDNSDTTMKTPECTLGQVLTKEGKMGPNLAKKPKLTSKNEEQKISESSDVQKVEKMELKPKNHDKVDENAASGQKKIGKFNDSHEDNTKTLENANSEISESDKLHVSKDKNDQVLAVIAKMEVDETFSLNHQMTSKIMFDQRISEISPGKFSKNKEMQTDTNNEENISYSPLQSNSPITVENLNDDNLSRSPCKISEESIETKNIVDECKKLVGDICPNSKDCMDQRAVICHMQNTGENIEYSDKDITVKETLGQNNNAVSTCLECEVEEENEISHNKNEQIHNPYESSAKVDEILQTSGEMDEATVSAKIVQPNINKDDGTLENVPAGVISPDKSNEVSQSEQTQSFSQESNSDVNQLEQTQAFLTLEDRNMDSNNNFHYIEPESGNNADHLKKPAVRIECIVPDFEIQVKGHEGDGGQVQNMQKVQLMLTSHVKSKDSVPCNYSIERVNQQSDAIVPDVQSKAVIDSLNFEPNDVDETRKTGIASEKCSSDSDEITDSQLCNIDWIEDFTLPERFERKTSLQQDGTKIVQGLIKELSHLNIMILRTKRELESARRQLQGQSVQGNQQNKILPNRTFFRT